MNSLSLVVVLCIVLPYVLAVVDLSQPAINKEQIEYINSKQSSWKAGVNERFVGYSREEFQRLLGWRPNPSKKLQKVVNDVAPQIPTQFNSATNWPNCPTIGTIYNQADCGSCWAFGCVEAVSDRFCIASNAAINYVLSFMDLVNCDQDDGGCFGGDADSAFNFVQENGLVSGTCSPYTIPTCPPQQQPCLNFVNTPDCVQECNDTEVWSQSLHYLSNAYDVSSDVSAIQTEIMKYGPVEACFTVYDDFVNYKSGVYQQTSDNALGGHCIKIIGWGVENGLPYWLCNNSWTTYWGDQGQFKILRGQDECGIEDDVVAGTPQLNN